MNTGLWKMGSGPGLRPSRNDRENWSMSKPLERPPYPREVGGAAVAADAFNIVEREPAALAARAQPAEAAENHRADRIAQHQADHPPRRAVGRHDPDLFDVGEGRADQA